VANPSRSPRSSPAASSPKAESDPNAPVRVRSRGRPPVISTERLLEVARQVFLELGIRATTSEVASRAGIAEGTIFHRFKSKEELFRAAMNFDPDVEIASVESILTNAKGEDSRQTLVAFAEHFIVMGRVALPVMMMSWSNPEQHLCAERTSERATHYSRLLVALSGCFAEGIRRGLIRQAEPEVLSRMLIGSLHHFCMTELFMGGMSGRFGHREFAKHVVDVLLGVDPSPRALGDDVEVLGNNR
jgi:AcrR family transcriptional regulator